MTPKEIAQQIITSMNRLDPLAVCQDCERAFHVHRAGLFFVTDMTADARKRLQHRKAEIDSEYADLRKRQRYISSGSQVGAKATNMGFTLEALAPVFPTFPLNRHDCRPLGDPIDFIAFENLAQHGHVDRIIFGDLKSGNARLSDRQRSIRTTIALKRLEFDLYAD